MLITEYNQHLDFYSPTQLVLLPRALVPLVSSRRVRQVLVLEVSSSDDMKSLLLRLRTQGATFPRLHRHSIICCNLDIHPLKSRSRSQLTINMFASPSTQIFQSKRLISTNASSLSQEQYPAFETVGTAVDFQDQVLSINSGPRLGLPEFATISQFVPVTSSQDPSKAHNVAFSSSIQHRDCSVLVSRDSADDCLRTASRTEQSNAANDAIAHGSRARTNICEGEENEPLALPNSTKDELRLRALLFGSKTPAQVEWESLWYHGLHASAKNIACHYPELPLKNHENTILTSQHLSEPQLCISDLNKEEQRIFAQEENLLEYRSSLGSESERQARVVRAQDIDDDAEHLALLLGIPTFSEYIAQSRLESKPIIENTPSKLSKSRLKREARIAIDKQRRALARDRRRAVTPLNCKVGLEDEGYFSNPFVNKQETGTTTAKTTITRRRGMSHENSQAASSLQPAQHRPLVVGLTKPPSSRSTSTMASSSEVAALNKEIAENVKENVTAAGPSEDNLNNSKQKKEKAPKPPKQPKAAPVAAPTSPALIDLRVGHILRAIAHPNADSLYVSTIAMGDPEGTEHTSIDEQTGKVVRTVCSGLNGLVPLEEMQDRKIIVVANLKPVNMRSIKSAAMVLAASPKQPEGADPHAPDRVVELVVPPAGAEAGDKVYFDGWPYGDGKGPEKQLNPKKKQWEAIQPGFYTGDDLVVGFNAAECPEVEGDAKGQLVVEGKGACTVKTLKGAVVR